MIRKYKILFGGGIVFIVFLIIALLILTQDSKAQSSTWNVVTLKEYVDQRNEYIDTRFDLLDIAITKQEDAYNERFRNTNEWRSSYEDILKKMQELIQTMQRDYVPRTELTGIERRLEEQKARLDKYENMKAGQGNTIAWLAAAFGLLVAIIALSRNFIASINKPNRRDEK